MNNKLLNLDFTKLCIFDIETVPQKEFLTPDCEEVVLLKNKLKDKVTLEEPTFEKVNEYYQKNAGLSPIYGKIACISVAIYAFKSEEVRTMSWYGDDEKDILRQFTDFMRKHKYILGGHNIIGFDLPFARLRYFINGLHYEEQYQFNFNDSGSKPWVLADAVVDTMDIGKGTKFVPDSLAEYAFAFKLASPKDDINGAEVRTTWYAGEQERVAKYCEKDVGTVANLILNWVGLSPLPLKSATFNTLTPATPNTDLFQMEKKVFEVIEKNLWQKVNEAETLAEYEEELLEQFKDAPVSEHGNISEILYACFAFSDRKHTIPSKKKARDEVKNFMNLLRNHGN